MFLVSLSTSAAIANGRPLLQTEPILFIKSELDLQSAAAACTACADQIAATTPLLVEFDKPNATIFALQVAISCKNSLQDQDGFLGFGPIATRELGQLLKETIHNPGATMPVRETV